MNWLIKLGAAAPTVAIPDEIPAGAAPFVRGDARVTWHAAHQVLSVERGGVERNLRLRGTQVVRFEGDAAYNVATELLLATGVASLSATAELAAPGMDGKVKAAAKDGLQIRSQITGKVLAVLVTPGAVVEAGAPLLVVEAMKMENKIFAPQPGVVKSIAVKAGDAVQTGKELLRLGPPV